jgi:hypothetical protein
MPSHGNIVINHAPSDNARHAHAEEAIKDAFASVRRQIDTLPKEHYYR